MRPGISRAAHWGAVSGGLARWRRSGGTGLAGRITRAFRQLTVRVNAHWT
ncbi:MAG: hypothetical protein M3Z75_29835 [Actinomycetota bacterium]|nr:hypothetical protein [Actinomycetota bacterium]